MRLVLVALAALIAGSTVASAAETGMLPNGARITWERFFIQRDDEFIEPPTPDDRRLALNFAHCACSQAGTGPEQKFQYELKLTTNTGTGRPAEVWVGTNCGDDQLRPTQCRKIEREGIRDIDAMATNVEVIELSYYELINATDQMGACVKKEGDALLWVLVDTNGDGTFDYTSNIPVAGTAPATGNANTEVTKVDTQEPPQPTDFEALGGEGSVTIEWTPPTSGQTDIYYYQALCADETGAIVQDVEAPDPLYETTATLCGLPSELALSSVETDGDGAPISEPLAAFSTLDPAFLCGEAPATAPSLTISGLENGKSYQVAVVVVDYYGNPVGSFFNRMVVPKPVTDFWEDLNDRNSAVDGGCLLATTYGDGNPLTQTLRSFRDQTLARTAAGRALTRAYYATAGKLGVYIEGSLFLRVIVGLYLLPFVVLALLWHVLTLPGLLALALLPLVWRRLKRRALVAIALLVPAIASADDLEPYWQTDEQDDATLLDVPDVRWHIGVRLGPYTPDIDLQFPQNAVTGMGPYEAMFGDWWTAGNDVNGNGMVDRDERRKHDQRVWQVLPMLDVDRVVWDGFGHITVGGSIGYMQKTARAYLDGTSENDDRRLRSESSKNTFRLIPTALTVGYRFTMLDEMWGIPVVPYVRGGLSYYMWWIKGPNGDTSSVCDEIGANMMCASNDKAYGGTLGFQGSIGLSIRAERVDRDAAISMRSSGLDHAGFYAEYQYAKVDGFGSDSKLWVGDNTWFAGIDFEF